MLDTRSKHLRDERYNNKIDNINRVDYNRILRIR